MGISATAQNGICCLWAFKASETMIGLRA